MPKKQQSKHNALARHEVDWEDDNQILAYFLDKWDNRDQLVGGLYKRWYEMLACYEGFFYLSFDEAVRRFVNNLKIPSWRVQLVINLLLPAVRTQVAKLMRNRPIFDVLPATDSNADISVARLNKQIIQGYWFSKGFNEDFVELLYWLALTGQGYLYTYWDPFAGPLHQLTVADFLDVNKLNNQYLVELALQEAQERFQKFVRRNKSDKLFLGDACLAVPTPFDVLHPIMQKFASIDWLIHAQLRDISYYEDLGIDTTDFSKPSDDDTRFITFHNRLNVLTHIDIASAGTANLMQSNKILELNCWLARSNQFKDGYLCTIAGGKVLRKGPNPYQHGQIPFTKFVAERTPGKSTGTSSAIQTLPIIRQYMKTKSQVTEIKNLMAKPKWLVPKTAGLLETSLTSEPGEVIEYTGLVAPQQLPVAPIPRYVFELMNYDLRDIQEIMAQQDALKGINPAGSRSATMLANLQGENEGQLQPLALDLDTGFSRVGRLLLSTIHQFSREERILPYTNSNNKFDVIQFKNTQMVGDNVYIPGADYFNVRVSSFSQFGLTRAGQMDLLKTLLQYNIFTPEDRGKILEMLELGFVEDRIDDFKMDKTNQHQENLMFYQGQPISPQPTDHHETHIKEAVNETKTEKFKTSDPQIQALFYQHIEAHKMLAITEAIKPQIMSILARLQLAKQYQLPPQLIPLIFGVTQPNERQRTGQ